ncbi:MAG: acyl-ACP--UDP-N-acetylglucosamine O-acyltransferase [Candidatus Omnitrophica bacterium]|nr:acyl-ACP--UDP-N-acetylglucosamine O-acyltransferase [Candidatus Omnitrophota bacterium]
MIDKTAVIEDGAVLGRNVSVGPYSVVKKGVILGDNVSVESSACIKGDTVIGANTIVGVGAVIGENPQMVVKNSSPGKIVIGKNNVIREYVTINSSSSNETVTCLGDNNYLMAFAHLGHDCKLGNNVVICNGVLLAGHVSVGDKAFLSGYVAVHQFCRIGRLAMISGLSRITQDVVPFMMVIGNSQVLGVNSVGLKRAGFTVDERKGVKAAFFSIYRKESSVSSALGELKKSESDVVKEIVSFIESSKRGICSGRNNSLLARLVLDYPILFAERVKACKMFVKNNKSCRFF